MNLKASPAVLAELRLYAAAFADRRPPVFDHFPGGADPVFPFEPGSDRGLGVLLLAAALHRPGGEAAGARLLAGLYRRHGNDIFRLNRLPFDPLREAVEALAPLPPGAGPGELAERDRIAGILRSGCDFFFRVGALSPWLAAAPDWETRVAELCHEIYWMGLRSRTRHKARLFFWMACLVPGFGARHPQAAVFTWPTGEGHERFRIDILGARAVKGADPEDRLEAFAVLAREAFPAEPWRLYQPLDAFLRREAGGDYVCRVAQGGCRPCPLAARCPAAPHFLSAAG